MSNPTASNPNHVEHTVNTQLESELARAEYEPLLPIEKKLIAWSLGIGVTLLIILAAISRLFPAPS